MWQKKPKKQLTTTSEVYDQALAFLDRRDHCESELRKKLKRKGAANLDIDKTVVKLKEYNLLNEERYARKVYEAWLNKKIYGRLHLQAELMKKNVMEPYASEILKEFTDEMEEERALAAYAKTRNRRDRKYDCGTETGVAALMRYMASRGFGGSCVRMVLEQARKDLEEG